MRQVLKKSYTTRRLKNSVNGNPRYQLITTDGLIIGSTRPDSPIAYGDVPHFANRGECVIVVHETPTGRRYVEDVALLSNCVSI